jgi:imidazolonepropionase-like amidohydrolase
VTIGVGTDAGSPNNPHGDVAGELELFARAGLPNMFILKSATSVSARTMGRGDDLGTLEAGKLADVIAVDGNPADDISAIRNVRLVIKDGEIVHQA